jgi:hypothetical protein
MRYCPLGGRPFDCADGTSASGGEAYFSLAMEWRLRRALRSSPNPRTRASRPIEASNAVACYVRNTSILLKKSEIERSRKSSVRARRVASADSPNGRACGRVTDRKTSQSAEPLRNFASRLAAGF